MIHGALVEYRGESYLNSVEQLELLWALLQIASKQIL